MLPSEVFFNNFLDSMDNDKKMQCDIYEKDNNINIEMDIPGFNKEDINIEINKGNLVVTAEKNEEENEDKIVKRKKIDVKPMDEEEAILQMELLGHDFYVFNNIDEECISVLYRRKDGNYGIINTK